MTTGQVLEAGQRADADGWEWERSSAAGLLAVWGRDSGGHGGAILESAVWGKRRRGAEVHRADPR